MPITVKSHVGRDVLQNADYFNSIGKVVIEYVTNSLDAGILLSQPVRCEVTIKKNLIIVRDDACGMSYDELNINFFTMHGENTHRKRSGVKPRGRFGTGKIAAFGVANCLKVDTIKSGLRNVVELTRNDLENAINVGPIPVREVTSNKSTKQHSRTIIRISDFHTLRRADDRGAITELKRALNKYLEKHIVIVNGERIRYEEPEFIKSYSFNPPSAFAKKIGGAELKIKVANAPLEDNMQGVSITANGWLQETTLAGVEGKPFSEFLFGEVEIPELDEERKVRAFDNTRTLRLNRTNPLVTDILNWLKESLEQVRTELAEQYHKQKQTEEMQRLQEEAQKIQEILNDDYAEYRNELVIANPGLGGDLSSRGKATEASASGVSYVQGDSVAVAEDSNGEVGASRNGMSNPRGHGDPMSPVDGSNNSASGSETDGIPPNKDESISHSRKRSGGFMIQYRNESANANRSRYIPDQRIIVINLDHPQVASINRDYPGEHRLFQLMTHEIAFIEYALAIVHEFAARGIKVSDAFDALVQCREIIDRVSKRAAKAYSNEAVISI